ncbi:hypothetical protein IAD21_02494 [Abditibacteriota bacterium]|nr:hypothetical protein IAD21_02494 [Abditibacteriota bacterium]
MSSTRIVELTKKTDEFLISHSSTLLCLRRAYTPFVKYPVADTASHVPTITPDNIFL